MTDFRSCVTASNVVTPDGLPLGDYEAVYPAPVCQEKYPAPGYARSDALPGEPTLGVDVLRFDSGWQ